MKIVDEVPYCVETIPLIGTFVMKELKVNFESLKVTFELGNSRIPLSLSIHNKKRKLK